jgi:hypothetical protein
MPPTVPNIGDTAEFVGQAVSLRRIVNPPADQYANAAQAGSQPAAG